MSALVLTELYTVRGETILVSPEDYRSLARYQWRINAGYAVRQVYAGGGRANRRFKYQSLHRLVLPPQEGMVTDHINGKKSDNRRENLRYASVQDNNRNTRNSPASNTGLRGVHRIKGTNVYLANIRHEGKVRHVGRFLDPVEAAIARDAAAREYHG